MSQLQDYYEVLGVARDADATVIKSAYRKMAIQYHPDKNPGDAEAEVRFKAAAEAYAVLSDPQKRQRYDRFGHQGVSGGAAGFDPSVFSDFSDILGDIFGFGDLFGGGRRRAGRSGQSRGADLRYDLTLSFEEAAFGTETQLRIPRLERCASCSGSGVAPGSRPITCNTCGGHGQVRFSQGFFTVARTCPECQGEGRIIKDPCKTCHGEGLVEQQRRLDVKIPAGVDTGARLRLAGEGEHGRQGGPAGDLYVVIRVQPHEIFEREGADVLGPVPVSYSQAVLGASIEVATLHGPATIDVPPGTPHGKIFRLKNKGIERLGSHGKGDHVAQVVLEVPDPKRLDDEQVELLRKLAELEGRPVREGVFEKVKKVGKEIFG
ncbi:MAG: molecular chaperone DnaJ [Acidobacteria bacterium]|nr:molecular chaperone DnaJ [Acidobacteriota bacterium]